MVEHKHCQKCLQVMRWKDTLLKASAGHEMNTFVKCVCRSSTVIRNSTVMSTSQSTVIRNSTVMRWINPNTVKCVSHEVDGHLVKSAGHEMDGHKHCQMSAGHEMDRPPPPPPACSNESLAHSYHLTNFLPQDMNETAANASAYIACKGIYESKIDYN